MSDSYIQTRLRWKSTAFLMYLRNTLYAASAHTAALSLHKDNLPRLTGTYKSIRLASGMLAVQNDADAPDAVRRYRPPEEIEKILHASAA